MPNAVTRKGDVVFPHPFVLPRPRPAGLKLKKHKGKIAAAVAVGTIAAATGGMHLYNKYKQDQANRAFENHSADMYNLIYPPSPRSATRIPSHYHGGIADVRMPGNSNDVLDI